MKATTRVVYALVAALAVVASQVSSARAADAGVDADAAADASDDAADASDAAASDDASGIQPTTTGDNWGCDVGRAPAPDRGVAGALAFAVALGAIAAFRRRRRRRRRLLLHPRRGRLGRIAAHAAPLLVTSLPATFAHAAPPEPAAAAAADAPPVEAEPPMRRVALYVTPLSLLVDRYGGSLEVLLASHHAIEAGAYYVYCATNADAHNVFEGMGGELGYRFYLGRNGPRGFYVGPSFLLSALTATPAIGPSTSYLDLGGALDVGFQALVADRVLLGLGVGAQYTLPASSAAQSFPQQQVPASVYANAGLRPRVSIAIGVAF